MYEMQTDQTILRRMLDTVPNDVDKREGSVIYDALAPAAIELAQMYAELDTNVQLSFGETASGDFLEKRAAEFGVDRRDASFARRRGLFYDRSDDPFDVPLGSRFAISDVSYTVTAQEHPGRFVLTCETAGAVGNRHFGALLPIDYIDGLAGAELTDVLIPGEDEESDDSLRARYLAKTRSPSAGGNKADYVNWTLEVAGVGGVSVVPVRDGPGTVSVAIIDSAGNPASQALVDAVQTYIAPPNVVVFEAEDQVLSDDGTSIDTDQEDASGGKCVRMEYDADGSAGVSQDMSGLLVQPGLWNARVRVKVDEALGADDLLRVAVYNTTTEDWAQTSQEGGEDASSVYSAGELSESFADAAVPFYWNGADALELRVIRLQDDATTTVWADQLEYRSVFSTDSGSGKAPIGARVRVEPAMSLLINVSAALTISGGYNADSVKASVQQAMANYIRSLAFADDNDVRYVRIGQAILDTTGVMDYQGLTVNGGTSNIAVGIQEVAVLGTVTWS